MPAEIDVSSIQRIRRFSLRSTLTGFIRNPLKQIEEIGRKSGGDVAQLDLGIFTLYIATHPDHIQYVFGDDSSNY